MKIKIRHRGNLLGEIDNANEETIEVLDRVFNVIGYLDYYDNGVESTECYIDFKPENNANENPLYIKQLDSLIKELNELKNIKNEMHKYWQMKVIDNLERILIQEYKNKYGIDVGSDENKIEALKERLCIKLQNKIDTEIKALEEINKLKQELNI